MTGRYPSLRFVLPSAVLSLLLLTLSGVTAAYLVRLQRTTAEELGENVQSLKAAIELEDVASPLVRMPADNPAAVAAAHEQIPPLIELVAALADKPQEAQFVHQIQAGYRDYLEAWRSLPPADDPARPAARAAALVRLDRGVVKLSQDLQVFNAEQMARSEAANRSTLLVMAWGLAVVGVVGSIGGMVMGYGLAKWFRQAVHRLQVRVEAAAGKIGQDLPAVVLTGDASRDELHDQFREIAHRVEQVVQHLQKREREVLRAEQLAAVGQLAAGMAHEVRNPLTSIKLLIETLREEAGQRGTAEDFDVILAEVRRMEQSLNTFLEFSRPPRLEKAPQDLGRLVEQTLSLVQGRAVKQNVGVDYERPAGPVVIEADGGQLQQVFVNLALNSLDAMPAGGRLHVAVRPSADGQVELEVTDTGPGIAPDDLPRLFEPFHSNKETGLGLGLMTSRRIVEDHGGSLSAANRSGGGARFVVRLPVLAG